MLTNFSLLAALAAVSAHGLKVGVISDIHLNLAYSGTGSEDDNCTESGASSDNAPLGRIKCDPSEQMADYMVQRFVEAFGDVDVILAPGDAIAHHTAPHHDDPGTPDWEPVRKDLEASANLLKKHFPDTKVLWSVGNNDGWHSQAPDESQKESYFSYLYNLWITGYPGNASFAASVKDTFMSAGYYRVDLSDTISVLLFENEYMDNDDDTSFQGTEAAEQLDWLEQQLSQGQSQGRKFILSGHVYAGARYHGSQLWHEEFAKRYFQITRDFHEQIVIEVMGHDHYADLRYHSSDNVLDLEDTDSKFDFHNMLVAPGITPNKGNQPGVAVFEVSDAGVPSNLRFEFMDLVSQVGASSVDYSDIKFFSLDMAEYGLTTLTASALSDLRKVLEDDQEKTLEYLTRKLGFDANDEKSTQLAYDVLIDKDLISTKKHKTGEYICQMHKSLSPDEYEDCCDQANGLDFFSFEQKQTPFLQ